MQRKRNSDMTHHGWTHIQSLLSMSPMSNYVPVLLAALLGPDAFGVPFVLELQSLRNSTKNDPLSWSQAWLSSSVPPPPLPHILPARRTVTHANYTVTGEEKTHIFFFSLQQLGLSIYLSAIYNSLRQGGLISSHHHFSK